MTLTADRIVEALASEDDPAAEVDRDGAWDDDLASAEPLTPAPPTVFEALMFPNDTAACLAHLVPSVELVPVLDLLTPSMLEVDGQIDALVAVERHIALLQARSTELLAALEAGDTSADGFTRDHVAAALRIPPASMRGRMVTARDLVERLPATLAMLRAGEITQRHALDLAELTRSLTPATAAVVEASVLPRAAEQTVAQFRASIRRAVLRVASPAEEEQAHTDAYADRTVIITPVEYGMAELWAYLSAEDAALISTVLDAIAHQSLHGTGGDDRSADQRRADALVHLAAARLGDPHLTTAHGQHPTVQVTVAASTLMGLDHQPAELDGYGSITAAMARRIAADPTATWRRLLTDDDGLIQAVGSKTYRPSADMTRTVIARDVHCQYPGCRKKARYTDLDHVRAYRTGDLTTHANLTALCRRHHRYKHSGEWTIHRDDHTGVTTWTDRKGRQYVSRPPSQPTTAAGSNDDNSRPAPPAPDLPRPEAEGCETGTPARASTQVTTAASSDLPPF